MDTAGMKKYLSLHSTSDLTLTMSSFSNPDSQARVSTRLSLRWLPEPPTETTDTLVLNVGDWYVDLRVDKISKKLDWALAGQYLRQDIPKQVSENGTQAPSKPDSR